jgi:pimeloyl-ACP methyl ester carboxylesterase
VEWLFPLAMMVPILAFSAFAIYRRIWAPKRALAALGETLRRLPPPEREAARRSWVRRQALISAGSWTGFLLSIASVGLLAGAWESTWHNEVPVLFIWGLSPIAIYLSSLSNAERASHGAVPDDDSRLGGLSN